MRFWPTKKVRSRVETSRGSPSGNGGVGRPRRTDAEAKKQGRPIWAGPDSDAVVA